MSEEWSDWTEHDGKGCPCVGALVESEDRHGEVVQHIAHGWLRGGNGPEIDCWNWNLSAWAIADIGHQIIRYRIRKPRGLTILENLIADLPVPVRKVDA